MKTTYSFASSLVGLDAVSGFNDIGFETYGTRSSMEFEEEAASVAKNSAILVSPPEWSVCCATVAADRLGDGVRDDRRKKIVIDYKFDR
jgi:hypothetical protein